MQARKASDGNIRLLNSEDIPKIIQSFTFPWSSFEKTQTRWQNYYNEQKTGVRSVAVIEQEDAILGYGSLLRKRIPEIHDVWIDEKKRNQGFGKALITWLENLARKEGFEQVVIGVGLYKDYGPAQRLYSKLGYQPDGKGITYKGKEATPGNSYPLDDDLILWLIKDLKK